MMLGGTKHKAMWGSMGFLPGKFAFIPSKKVWARELKKMYKGTDEEPPEYPDTEGACQTIMDEGEAPVCLVILADHLDGGRMLDVSALLVHESVHVFQKIKEYIEEEAPSAEFEAYAIQFIYGVLLAGYKATRNPKCLKGWTE